ncbi:class I SAM-dependent methyltransferase [Rhodocaloribacter litoris]|uniref:class I SAM-dependent methyltransferase n=1 Tax=Rhodocaloribacter litoris TaxID=2558931 RepID=UPI001421B3B5|nr:class I SAM-dependent methyltransferase [Rhodocaloribacter litoris]QXD15245.1 class I SAM-dependent methyltransferase [Rhodocaloribacter litoris]
MSLPYPSDNPALRRRYERTLRFLRASLPPPARLLDLGAPNPLARVMQAAGYTVQNTHGDLDEHPEIVCGVDVEAVTAFEILEHLVGPLNVLRAIRAPRLFATVPLRLWFARAYRNPSDPWDRHFHEFEDWQFDWLLEKAGWRIVRREKWTSPGGGFGIRPVLRRFVPRYYAVEAVRNS